MNLTPSQHTRAVSVTALILWLCLAAGTLLATQTVREQSGRPRGVQNLRDLYQHWVRSYEEEPSREPGQIFRPAASRHFPPSRFRMAYKFSEKGSCETYVLSPDDNHHFEAGRWALDAQDSAILRITTGGITTSYRILSLDRKLLRLRLLEPDHKQ